jgi:DNA-binding transcriptional ArsR family regulator
VIADPALARAELISLLEEYLATEFAAQVPNVLAATGEGAALARDLLGLLPSVVAIEQLTGGYTLSDGLALTRITLAPSAFMYPFMASRVDERAGEALIVFGVRSAALLKFDQVPINPDLVRGIKTLGDPSRLRLLRLLGRKPMTGTELASAVGLSAPTVHHHLHQLRAAGLVRQERMKGGMQYAIRRDSADELLDSLRRMIHGSE